MRNHRNPIVRAATEIGGEKNETGAGSANAHTSPRTQYESAGRDGGSRAANAITTRI